jgi:CBS domain-containing protein
MKERVKDVMSRDVCTVSPEWTLPEIARLMRDENIGAVPVAEDDQLVGIVTDRDLVVRGIADDLSAARGRTARDVMTANLFFCFEDQTLDEALRRMHEQHVRRLPVVDRGKRLVGMVSFNDLSGSSGIGPAPGAFRRVSRAGLH